MNYKELYTALLDYGDRTALANLPQAKRAINDAMRWCNRMHNFKMAEGVVNVTYPANEFFMDLNVTCDQGVMNLITVQEVSASSMQSGKFLPIQDYATIQTERFKRWRVSQTTYPDSADYEYEDQPSDYTIFILGTGFGLYPTPTQDVELFLHFNERLRDLSDDADTNFLTDYCSDFLLTKALFSKFLVYLPVERAEQLAKDLVLSDWESVVAWDKQIRNSENFFGL